VQFEMANLLFAIVFLNAMPDGAIEEARLRREPDDLAFPPPQCIDPSHPPIKTVKEMNYVP